MDLFLIRHAEATEIGERGITNDEERPLTEHGEIQAEKAAQAFAARGIVLDKVLTSPLVRARQTADIFVRVWARPETTLEVCDALCPGGKMRKLSKALLKLEDGKVGLVGHMPQLGEFAAWLLGNKRAQIDLAKSGALCISCGDAPCKGVGALQWLVTPEWF